MKLISVEPTPSPNVMKLNVNETLAPGTRHAYAADAADRAPAVLRNILSVSGVKSVYQAADFIAVERRAGADWRPILAQVSETFDAADSDVGRDGAGGAASGGGGVSSSGGRADGSDGGGESGGGKGKGGENRDGGKIGGGDASRETDGGGGSGVNANARARSGFGVPEATAGYGEATVLVQMFRGIPMQVRVRSGYEETKAALPERFAAAAMKAGAASPNLIRERQLVERGVRYGNDLPEIAALVAAELDAAYDDARLQTLIGQAESMGDSPEAAPALTAAETLTPAQMAERLLDADWKVRYAALERLKPQPDHLDLVARALADANFSVRRLAVVYLGEIKGDAAIRHLTVMLKDTSPAVRRTAGDALSDIGDPAAQPAMIEALADKSKIVRWRAARFLYDCGDESALGALRQAADDAEFEVALQARMAAERIESGEAAAGTVWQQMARSRDADT